MCRVLIVDDDDQVRATLALLVRAADHDPVTAADPSSALAILESTSIDLVVTDYRLGTASGLALAASIRERWSALPILLVSGDLDADLERLARSVGIAACLAKPFSPRDLWAQLEHFSGAPVDAGRRDLG